MPEPVKHVLFISYDGMTDPLGQSQVLPYLIGVSATGKYKVTILSCEKKARFAQGKERIQAICNQHGIDWCPIPFHTKPPILAKYYDFYQLEKKAFELYETKQFAIIHCRSYLSIEIGIALKKKFKTPKVIFDMRGFWVDERVDGGLWNLNNPFYKIAYSHYKKKEAFFIQESDYIVSLTEAGKKEIERWPTYRKATPISVIPCSADFNLFSLTDAQQKKAARVELGLNDTDLVISYLGSLGTWYMLDEMLEFFSLLKQKEPQAKFLILTPESKEMVYAKLSAYQLNKEDFVIVFAQRAEVSKWMKASDVSLSFIKNAYSKIASSPTKMGELLAMGIPVIANSGIGDVKEIIEKGNGGIVIDGFTKEAYLKAIAQLPEVLRSSPATIRANYQDYYNLDHAISNYRMCYEQLLR